MEIIYLIIFIHQILFWVYLWQIKEYRIDRFRAGWNSQNLIRQFDLRHWPRPKLTARAFFSVVISLICLIRLNLEIIILAPILITIFVGAVSPIFILYKKILIEKAKRKMKNYNAKLKTWYT